MRQLRRILAGPISVAKRTLPTGELTDDLLNYIHGWAKLGYLPHVSSPRSFNEHILSSKWRFRGDIELARRVTDKYFFKEWLAEKGFDDLIIPTVGLYNNVEEVRNIIFDENTILKPTHLSGWVLPFHESRKLRVDEISKLKKWLRTDYYRKSREKTYKGVRKRLICEQLLLDSGNDIPMDYKFFLCRGQPLMIQVDIDRFDKHTRQLYSVPIRLMQTHTICSMLYSTFYAVNLPLVGVCVKRIGMLYSTDWELLDVGLKYPRNPVAIDRPTTLDTALEVASALSHDFPICRVDLYLLPNDIIKAGEIMFSPGGGGESFSPESVDFSLGERMK